MQLSSRFETALSFAARLHAEQQRKSTEVPYISHLLSVCGLVLEHGGTEEQAIAALLHDAIEDQGGAATRETILRLFGSEVAAIVEGCTDADTIPKPPWRERKERYLAHLADAPEDVRLISCADKLHNARTILADLRVSGAEVWNRFRGGREGTLWYYRALVTAFTAHGITPLVAEFERAVMEMERLSQDA
jgi:(p)ppGpp synthase/HD superfamily hydrolase